MGVMGRKALIAIFLAVMVSIAAAGPGAANHAEFISGKGQATARVWRFNTQYGQIDVPIGVGKTRAGYLENHAYASAEVFDAGVLRLPNTVKLCGSSDDVPIPEPTEANTSANGGKRDVHSKTVSGSEGAGYEEAAAYPGSRGTARATGINVAIPGLVEMVGGSAFSESRMDPKRHTRLSTSTANVGVIRLLGGFVELKGLRWTMTLEATGTDSRTRKLTKKELKFTFGDAILAGQALPTGTDAERVRAIEGINRAINPLGLLIRLPELKKQSPTSYELTSLFVGVGGTPIYGEPVYDLLANSDNDTSLINLYDQASRGLFDARDCNQLGGAMKQVELVNVLYNTTGLLVPIVVSALGSSITGGSTMGFEFGKTSVQLDDTYYPPPPLLDLPPVVDLPFATPVESPAATPSLAAPAASPPPAVLARPASGQARASGTKLACRTTSPAGRPRCWDGAGVLAGGLALAAVLALFIGDEAWRRRRRATTTKGAAIS